MQLDRRFFVSGGLAVLTPDPRSPRPGTSITIRSTSRCASRGASAFPKSAAQQHVYDSPAPKAANAGRWIDRAPLPLPRSEMAWAAEHAGRMHLVGGYGEQRVDRPYHHVYDPAADRWLDAAPLPRGANHVGVAVLDGRLYAIGGFVEQNRKPHDECFVWEAAADALAQDRAAAARLRRDRLRRASAASCTRSAARSATPSRPRRSVDWHLAYDPAADRWESRAPLLHRAATTPASSPSSGRIHVIGGRVDSLLHQLEPAPRLRPASRQMGGPRARCRPRARAMARCSTAARSSAWAARARTASSARTRPTTRRPTRWEQYAPMTTPRHGLGAVTIGDAIHVAGGGPVMGGGVQSAVHEAFTLG